MAPCVDYISHHDQKESGAPNLEDNSVLLRLLQGLLIVSGATGKQPGGKASWRM